MRSLDYPPHLTLAVYDDVDRRSLVEAVDAIGQSTGAFAVRFDGLSYFDAPHAVILWARPAMADEVIRLHKQIHARIGPHLSRLNYRPGHWTPHCTLATAISRTRRDEALALAERQFERFEVIFDVADCTYFHPVEVLHERPLASSVA